MIALMINIDDTRTKLFGIFHKFEEEDTEYNIYQNKSRNKESTHKLIERSGNIQKRIFCKN
jgi:hypothetical protein